MKKFLPLLLTVSLTCIATAGNQTQLNPTAASRAYHEYRLRVTEPTYGLAKVKALVRHIKTDGNDNMALPLKQYNALSTNEKFTYAMIHGEISAQNCDAMPAIVGEESKIFGHPLEPDDEEAWSDRQIAFLHNHRGSVIALLRSTIRSHDRVGVNLKKAILEIEAYELIPDILAVYKRDRKDLDILSVCMMLMKDGNFKPFTSSITYKKLYSDQSNYQGFVNGNRANQDLEIQRATAYYRSRSA